MRSRHTDHKEGRASADIYYKTGKTLADGSHPFQIRITKLGDKLNKAGQRITEQVYRSTGLSLHPKFWNAEKKHVRKSYPDKEREELLEKLEEWRSKYDDAAKALAETEAPHTAADVLAKVVEERESTRKYKLLEYCDTLTQSLKATGRTGNAIVYNDLRNQLAKFILSEYNAKDISFERVTVAFCNQWEDALRATGAEDTTLSNRFRTLRAVLNKAIANGVTKAEYYPFARTVAEKHKFSVGKFDVSTVKRAISRDELRRLEALDTPNDRHRLAKDVFLFSFYCGGINYVDLAQLRWRDLSGTDEEGQPQRLNYVRQKTGGKFSLRLLAPASAIVMTYRPFTFASSDSYIFPILDRHKHQTSTQVKNRLHKVLGQVNRDLKTLGEQAGIASPLTTYVARHSMATTLKMGGASMAVISQAMGHKSEAVTAVYLDSFASELIDTTFEKLL